MSNLFKVGDRVRCIDPGHNRLINRREYVVSLAHFDGVSETAYVQVFGLTQSFYESRFELISSAAPAPTKIDLSTLQPGDKVTVTETFTVTQSIDEDGDIGVNGDNIFGLHYLFGRFTPTGTVEKAPVEPLKFGDRVSVGGRPAVILAIADGHAWLKRDTGLRFSRPLAQLDRA